MAPGKKLAPKKPAPDTCRGIAGKEPERVRCGRTQIRGKLFCPTHVGRREYVRNPDHMIRALVNEDDIAYVQEEDDAPKVEEQDDTQANTHHSEDEFHSEEEEEDEQAPMDQDHQDQDADVIQAMMQELEKLNLDKRQMASRIDQLTNTVSELQTKNQELTKDVTELIERSTMITGAGDDDGDDATSGHSKRQLSDEKLAVNLQHMALKHDAETKIATSAEEAKGHVTFALRKKQLTPLQSELGKEDVEEWKSLAKGAKAYQNTLPDKEKRYAYERFMKEQYPKTDFQALRDRLKQVVVAVVASQKSEPPQQVANEA